MNKPDIDFQKLYETYSTLGESRACVGCGFCCSAQPCPLAFMGGWWREGSCDLIHWDGSRYRCRFVDFCESCGLPQVAKGILGIGYQCDGEEGKAPWRENVRQRSLAEAREVRTRADYEDGTAREFLDQYCGDEAARVALTALIIETNRLFGHSAVTLLEAESVMKLEKQ